MRRNEEDGSLDPQAVVLSVYNVYRLCRDVLGAETAEWDELETGQDAWLAAVNAGDALVKSSEDDPVTWTAIAEAMYAALAEHMGLAEVAPKFADLPEHLRLLWDCLARHLANMLAFDTEEESDTAKHEDHMMAVYQQKMHRNRREDEQ